MSIGVAVYCPFGASCENQTIVVWVSALL